MMTESSSVPGDACPAAAPTFVCALRRRVLANLLQILPEEARAQENPAIDGVYMDVAHSYLVATDMKGVLLHEPEWPVRGNFSSFTVPRALCLRALEAVDAADALIEVSLYAPEPEGLRRVELK